MSNYTDYPEEQWSFSDRDKALLDCALWVAQHYSGLAQVVSVVEQIVNSGDVLRADRWPVHIKAADRRRIAERHGGERLVDILPASVAPPPSSTLPPPQPSEGLGEGSLGPALPGRSWHEEMERQLSPEHISEPAEPATAERSQVSADPEAVDAVVGTAELPAVEPTEVTPPLPRRRSRRSS
jgi:hypothetical protein